MAESQEAEDARMLSEVQTMRRAISDVHEAFAWFESGFAWVLRRALGARHSDAAAHIYFAPSATETRLRVVDSVVRLIIVDRWEFGPPDDDSAERFLAQWSAIMNRANRLRKTRNEVIHGQIIGVRPGQGATGRLKTRLMPIIADVERHVVGKPKQYPGLSANDIQQSARAIGALTEDLIHVQQILDALNKRDAATFLRRLGELESRRQRAALQKGGRKPPAPDAPPPS